MKIRLDQRWLVLTEERLIGNCFGLRRNAQQLKCNWCQTAGIIEIRYEWQIVPTSHMVMVVVLWRTFIVVGRVAGRSAIVTFSRFLGTMRLNKHFTRFFGNDLGVESNEDSNQKEQWQNVTHYESV